MKNQKTEIVPASIQPPSTTIKPIEIHTGSSSENKTLNQTGITVHINTNGTPTRNMTPEELRLFQQKIQKK